MYSFVAKLSSLKRKGRFILPVIACTTFLLCCNNNKKQRIIHELQEQTIAWPDSVQAIRPNGLVSTASMSQYHRNPILLTIINGNCSWCVKDIILWQQAFNKPPLNQLSPVLWITRKDTSSFLYIYDTELKGVVTIPLFLDLDGQFVKKNPELAETTHRTFLLNAKHQIQLVGNPLHSPALMELYHEQIRQMPAPPPHTAVSPPAAASP